MEKNTELENIQSDLVLTTHCTDALFMHWRLA